MHRGNRVKDLDLALGAIRGSMVDTLFLLFRKRNSLLPIFVFAQLVIGAIVPLVTGLAIVREKGIREAIFTYNGTMRMPNSSVKELYNDSMLRVVQKILPWTLDGDRTHGGVGALRGTLVLPDARIAWATRDVPAGPRITGSFECQGWDNYTLTESGVYQIWVGKSRFDALAYMGLSAALWKVDTAEAMYLWVSNTTGYIPNATTTKDGRMDVAICRHVVEMVPEERRREGVDYLLPSKPLVSGCVSRDTNVCVADAVNNAILNWWGGTSTELWHMSCRGGFLGPLPSKIEVGVYCPLTQDLWKETVTGMLDAMVQTAPTSMPAVQTIEAGVETLNQKRWWIHAVIPAATLALYVLGLIWTCVLSQGDKDCKELNLEEVIRAAQTDHIHDLVLTGQLKRAIVKYKGQTGFVDTSGMSASANDIR